MADAHITDLGHLLAVGTRIQRHIEILTRHWIAEDHAAYTPPSLGDGPVDGGDTADLTDLATAPHRHRARDHIGNQLLDVDRRLTDLVNRRTPRRPDRRCTCCRTELATHGHDRDGQPTSCHPCWRYLRRMGHRCDDEIHDDRPRTRWCECPPECCPQDDDGNTACSDQAADGRSVSERCRTRMHRRRQADA